MASTKSRSRKDKIKFLKDIMERKVELLPPIEDLIIVHNNERISMKTGRIWIEEEDKRK